MVRESRSPPGPMPRPPLQTHPQLLHASSEGGSVLRGAEQDEIQVRSPKDSEFTKGKYK